MKVTFRLTPANSFFSDMSKKGHIINYLIEKEFGTDIGDTPEEQGKILARKMLQYTNLLREIEQKNDPPDKERT